MKRREILSGAAAFAALSVTGFSNARAAGWDETLATAKVEGKAVYYSSGIARVEEPQMTAFSKASGINVSYARPGGGEIVIRKFEQEVAGGAPMADVCSLTDYALATYAKDKGWVEPVTDLPNLAHLSAAFEQDATGILPTGAFGMVIVVNNKLLAKGDWPKSYKDLVDPKYKGKVLFGAPENAGSTTLLIKAFIERFGWEFVEKLRANDASEMRLQAEAMQAVSRGEKPICVVAQSWGFLNREQGAPIDVIFPEDGTVIALTAMFIAAKAPNPAASKVLANFLLSKDFQGNLSKFTGGFSSADGLPAPKGFPALADVNRYYPNLKELVATRGEIISRWRKIMS
jgi:iron(III) transport system substrate-binding protein